MIRGKTNDLLFFAVLEIASAIFAQGTNFSFSESLSPSRVYTYYSRADLQTSQLPNPIPRMGNLAGANTVITDPHFHNRVVRVTDANADPRRPNITFEAGFGGSSNYNLFNTDSSKFVVGNTTGGVYPYSLNKITLQVSELTTNQALSHGFWSYSNPNRFFEWGVRVPEIDYYDFASKTAHPVVNFQGHCGLPGNWIVGWQAVAGISADDMVFGVGYADAGKVQGQGVYVLAYKVGSGCSLWNTSTGQVTTDPGWVEGQSGTIIHNGQPLVDRFMLHDVKMSKDGNWMIIIPQSRTCSTTCTGPYFWHIGTTSVNPAPLKTGGHWTTGYTHFISMHWAPHIDSQLKRPFSSPSDITSIVSDFPPGLTALVDNHQSWANADPEDTTPFFTTTIGTLGSNEFYYDGATPGHLFPAAWYNEVLGISQSGTVWRFCHTFISTLSHRFGTRYAIGGVSQDGRYFVFSSDWMGTLGSEDGARSCTLGTNCRGDAFLVELK